jgi:uncharacterized membrane protein YeiB
MLRDIVDARYFTMGEILMVFMVISLFFTYTATTKTAPIVTVVSNIVLVLFALFIGDSILLARRSKKLLSKKFGKENVDRGIWFYVAVRSMYPRFMRTPKAKVRRGHKFN